jgi:hypothetical protein
VPNSIRTCLNHSYYNSYFKALGPLYIIKF